MISETPKDLRLSSIKSMLDCINIDELYRNMMTTNPQFKRFVEANKDKTTEDLAEEYGIELKDL